MSDSLLIGSARVAVVPDATGFQSKLRAAIDADLKSLDTEVPVTLEVNDASLAALKAKTSALPDSTVPIYPTLDVARLTRSARRRSARA